MPTVVLVNPKIPPNTGNIARLCAATNSHLHLVGDLGFDLSDKSLKRAGLDYWHLVQWTHYPDIEAYFESKEASQLYLVTTKGKTRYTDVAYLPESYLVFGSETVGLPQSVMSRYPDCWITIPMTNLDAGMRSLNLATAAGIVLYESLRQSGFSLNSY